MKRLTRNMINKLYQEELMAVITNDVDKLQGQAGLIADKFYDLWLEHESWTYGKKSRKTRQNRPYYGSKSRKTIKIVWRYIYLVIRRFVAKLKRLLTNS